VGLIFMANRWAWSQLVARVASIAGGDELFMILGAPCMISGVVRERPSLRFFDSINSRASGVNFLILPFHNFL
jgi:hypothetical protein